jgi:hypothetical protein
MTPVAAATKRRKFDLPTFLSTIDGGRTILNPAKGKKCFLKGMSLTPCSMSRRENKTQRFGCERKGSHNRHSVRGEILRGKLPRGAASAHQRRDRNDRLHSDADR